MIRIECKCLFDVTTTGVTGHFRQSVLPFVDKSNKRVISEQDWVKARNQQRNLETLLQLISLRTQVSSYTDSKYKDGAWYFDVYVEVESPLATFEDPLGILKSDCVGVPIILDLDEKNVNNAELILDGEDQNVWFESFSINTI